MQEFTLVLAEKPDAARRIASALGSKGVPLRNQTYEIPVAFDGKSYFVCSASGHLFQIEDPIPERAVFPAYDVDWFEKTNPARVRGRKDRYQIFQRRIMNISKFASNAVDFVNACDYDIEGETIGANILQFIHANPDRILRAKFSTLTDDEIRRAFLNLEVAKVSLATAGRIRHEIDFLWGINLSRALTSLANGSGEQFANVTIGRVQGPTIAFIVDREIEGRTHVPIPSWDLRCIVNNNGVSFEVRYKHSPVRTLPEAEKIYSEALKAKFAVVTSLQNYTIKLPPRYPFDLGELQKQAFYNYGMSPIRALTAAEKLYLKALISYPRTDSQKLPPAIQPERILHKLDDNQVYSQLIRMLLADPRRRKYPLQGSRDDPAHPAIYPTGQIPKGALTDDERNLYDLIVRRFLNVFASDAIIERTQALFEISSNEFETEWQTVIEQGWMMYYPFKISANPLPGVKLEKGDKIPIEKMSNETKFSRAPPRYNDATLLAKMEYEDIGTKSTRADTISTLIERKYVRKSKGLAPEENSLLLVHQLRENCPEIVSPEMTKSLEEMIELLQIGKESEAPVIAVQLSTIRAAVRKLMNLQNFGWERNLVYKKNKDLSLGTCPKCKTGSLVAIRSYKTKKRFIRCSNYNSGCKTSSPLPPRGLIRTANNLCNVCGWPNIVLIIGRRVASQKCSNFFCESKVSG